VLTPRWRGGLIGKPRLRGWDARSVFQISELTTVLLFELHLLKKTEAPISTNSQNRFGGRIQLTRLEGGVPYSNPGGPLAFPAPTEGREERPYPKYQRTNFTADTGSLGHNCSGAPPRCATINEVCLGIRVCYIYDGFYLFMRLNVALFVKKKD